MTVPAGTSPYAEANMVFRAMRRMAGLAAGVVAVRKDPFAHRLRRLAHHRPQNDICSTCQRSAGTAPDHHRRPHWRQRTQPVVYLREGDGFVVIASNWGQAHNPSWYYNLRANTNAEVTVSGSTYEVMTREVTGPQRDRYWQQGCLMYPAWNVYKTRSPHRPFPVMILSRAA